MQVLNNSPGLLQIPTPFDTDNLGSQLAASSGVHDTGATEEESSHDNPIQRRAQAWARQRQQERSVLSQHDSAELQPVMRTQSGIPDVAGSSIRSQLQHNSSQHAHDRTPHQSPRGSQQTGFGRRQSEPPTSIEDEWPALGTPPVTLHLPHTPPLHLPPPSPVHQSHRSPGQPLPGAQAALGFGWAANLARRAEWMGEATGLRFLTRPFTRTVVGMTGGNVAEAGAATDSNTASSLQGTDGSASGNGAAEMQSLERASSFSQPVSAFAPSNGSMSYRERLLAGASGQSNGQPSVQGMVRVSPSKQPSQGSQIGFPSQQELQASQSASAQQSSSPSNAASASAATAASPPSSTVPAAVSALSLRHSSQRSSLDAQGQRQAQFGNAGTQTPADRRFPADFAQSRGTHAPQAVPVLPQAAQVILKLQRQIQEPTCPEGVAVICLCLCLCLCICVSLCLCIASL